MTDDKQHTMLDGGTPPSTHLVTVTIAVVMLLTIGISGAVAVPSQAATIITLTGGLCVSLIALLREWKGTHDLINSRMSEMLELSRRANRSEAVEEERERVAHDEDESIEKLMGTPANKDLATDIKDVKAAVDKGAS